MSDTPALFEDDPSGLEKYRNLLDSPHVTQQLKGELRRQADADESQYYHDALRRAEQQIQDAQSLTKAQEEVSELPVPGSDSKSVPDARSNDSAPDAHTLLMKAEPGFGLYCRWIDQVWNQMPGVGPKDYKKEILEKFFRNDGVDFEAFLNEANNLKEAHGIVDESLRSARSSLNTLFDGWSGSGAQAAWARWEKQIAPDANDLSSRLESSATLIPEVVSKVYESMKAQVDEVLGMAPTTVEKAELDVAAVIAKVASDEGEASDTDCEYVAWFLNSYYGFTASTDDDFEKMGVENYIEHDDQDEIVPFARDWCGKFAKRFEELLTEFDDLCKRWTEAVSDNWDVLNREIEKITNEFNGGASAQEGNGSSPTTKPPLRGEDGGGASNDSGSVGGGGNSGGISTPPSTPASTPSSTTESQSAETGDTGAGSKSATTDQAMNPVTGNPAEINQETGEPYPIDPETGETMKGGGDERESLTVTRGEREISMIEPNLNGEMKVSVQDGSGNSSEFDLDFAAEGKGGQNQGGDEEAVSNEADSAKDSGSPSGENSESGNAPKVHEPGPDGAIHIEDGPLSLTAERPEGPDGPTVVTLDDGSGESVTYTLGANSDGVWDGSDGADTEAVQGSSMEDNRGALAGDADEQTGVSSTRGEAAPDGSVERGQEDTLGRGSAPDLAQEPGLAAEAATDGAEPVGDSPGGDQQESSPQANQRTSPQGLFADAVSGPSVGDGFGNEGGAGDPSASSNDIHSSAATSDDGSAGLGSAPGGGRMAGSAETASSEGSMRGVGGMMGAGMSGGGGQDGGEQQRGSSGFLVESGIFEAAQSSSRISGTLGEDPADAAQWGQ